MSRFVSVSEAELPGAGEHVIYFVQSPDNGLIKIGTTLALRQRLLGLRSMCPVRLDLVWFYPGDKSEEQQLHGVFDDSRAHGEWFRPTEEVVEFLRELIASGDRLFSARFIYARIGNASVRPIILERFRKNRLAASPSFQAERALLGGGR
jgi:hypothetical protein